MPLNKSKGNMYPWVNFTWNPIRGCLHDCCYCYLKSIPNFDMNPRIMENEMRITKLGLGNSIFVGSSCDMFGEWIPKDWITTVLSKCHYYNNQYLFQTKNPKRFLDFKTAIPEDSILGTTIETNLDLASNRTYAPPVYERYFYMVRLSKLGFKTMISIEPIMEFDIDGFINMISQIKPQFISIGADSKNSSLPEPEPQKVKELIMRCELFTKVKIKSNLERIIKQ